MNTTYKKIQPKLTILVTAPGGRSITAKGIRLLAAADVVLYNTPESDLPYPAYLAGKKIYIGKRGNNPAYTQEQVNALIVDLAFSYGHVVLLTAEPFHTGKELPELSYAGIFNIETEVVDAGSNEQQALKQHPFFSWIVKENRYLLN